MNPASSIRRTGFKTASPRRVMYHSKNSSGVVRDSAGKTSFSRSFDKFDKE
ncbi:hypothetical protein P3T23_009470 [Paraburkholderia sp. GAS448]